MRELIVRNDETEKELLDCYSIAVVCALIRDSFLHSLLTILHTHQAPNSKLKPEA